MGCSVNGLGESKNADIAITGGKNKSLLYRNGKLLKEINNKDIIKELINEIKK